MRDALHRLPYIAALSLILLGAMLWLGGVR